MEKLRRASVRAVTWSYAGYPWRLKEIPDPPPTLCIKGSILPEDERVVAVVGTRGPTAYGREAASVFRRLTQKQHHRHQRPSQGR